MRYVDFSFARLAVLSSSCMQYAVLISHSFLINLFRFFFLFTFFFCCSTSLFSMVSFLLQFSCYALCSLRSYTRNWTTISTRENKKIRGWFFEPRKKESRDFSSTQIHSFFLHLIFIRLNFEFRRMVPRSATK